MTSFSHGHPINGQTSFDYRLQLSISREWGGRRGFTIGRDAWRFDRWTRETRNEFETRLRRFDAVVRSFHRARFTSGYFLGPLSHALEPSSSSSSTSSSSSMIVVIGIARQTSIDSLRTTGKRVGEERSAGPDYDRVHRRVVSLHDLLGTRIDVRANLFTTSSLLSPILHSLSRTLHAWFIQIARPPRECFKSRSRRRMPAWWISILSRERERERSRFPRMDV